MDTLAVILQAKADSVVNFSNIPWNDLQFLFLVSILCSLDLRRFSPSLLLSLPLLTPLFHSEMLT